MCIVESRGYAEHIVSLCRTIAYVAHCFLRVSLHALHLLPVISGANLQDKSAQNCADCVADFPAEAKKGKNI